MVRFQLQMQLEPTKSIEEVKTLLKQSVGCVYMPLYSGDKTIKHWIPINVPKIVEFLDMSISGLSHFQVDKFGDDIYLYPQETIS